MQDLFFEGEGIVSWNRLIKYWLKKSNKLDNWINRKIEENWFKIS